MRLTKMSNRNFTVENQHMSQRDIFWTRVGEMMKDDNDIVIKRAAFQTRVDDVNTALDAAKTAAAAGSYLALADYWSADIADTSGLTNPEPVVEEPAAEEPAAEDPAPDPDAGA